MTEEKKEMTEEEKRAKKRKSQYESEKEEFFEWRDAVLLIDKGEILNLLIFKLNNNLERIADDLEEDSVLEGIVDELSLIKEHIEKDRNSETIVSAINCIRECLCSKEFLDAIKQRR